MLKTFKWIYRLGVLHERRRIELLIAEHRKDKPVSESWEYKDGSSRSFKNDLNLWYGVEYELNKLLSPEYYQNVTIEQPQIALIDKD